jgi:hypothetical protein
MVLVNGFRWAPALLVGLATASGCKMDPKECAKYRESAYDIINVPNNCETTDECKASEWPGCPKAVNSASFEKLRAMQQITKKGKCEEPKLPCIPVPKAYCEEGVCAFKYPRDNVLRIVPE